MFNWKIFWSASDSKTFNSINLFAASSVAHGLSRDHNQSTPMICIVINARRRRSAGSVKDSRDSEERRDVIEQLFATRFFFVF